MNLVRSTYTTTLRLATPALLAHLARRTRRQTGTHDNWRARLGLIEPDTRSPIWIHAASAGEMQAALPLAAALANTHPVRLSAFTASGLARAHASLPKIEATLAPLDLPGAWRRYFARANPRLAILLESELWPNLLAAARRSKLPVVLASARMMPAAAHRLGHFPASAREMLGGLADVFAQGGEDLERFYALGLPRERGRVTGNLKEAQTIPAATEARGRALRADALAGRKVWVAGSVRGGEEAFIAEAAARIRKRVPDTVALVIPRHPERAPGFIAALAAQNIEALDWEALANGGAIPAGAVVVVAKLGVLDALYAAADAAFVGGSFAPLGGHNLLEPAQAGVPVFAGPNLRNVNAAAERLDAAGALIVVRDAETLAAKLAALLQDPQTAQRMGAAARHVATNPESLDATLAALAPWL
ncbi:MAG: 3-deoxy-D-manno-octulosonic acid transferase [Gammaproteobacteria bacterium]